MRSILKIILQAWAIAHIAGSAAAFVPPFEESSDNHGLRPVNFVAPNEEFPDDAKALLRRAPEGIYLSVGTERAFMGFAMADRASHLMIVDADPKVIRFANINIALLAMSESLDEYRALRFAESHKIWSKKIKDLNLPKEAFSNMDAEGFEFWSENINREAFNSFHSTEDDANGPFAESNYLFKCGCFQKIHQAAQSGRIVARLVNFRDVKTVVSMVEAIKTTEIPLSTFDMSNAWWTEYMDPSRHLAPTLHKLTEISQPHSLMLATNAPLVPGILPKTRKRNRWYYIGFTMEYLKTKTGLQSDQLKNIFHGAKKGTLNLADPDQVVPNCAGLLR